MPPMIVSDSPDLSDRFIKTHNKKIDIISSSKDQVQFEVNNISMKEANEIRRMLMNLPTLSIDYVEILINTSCLPDETISHRLGMIPMISSTTRSNENNICSCDIADDKGCPICRHLYGLDIECPPNQPYLNVFSSDIKCKHECKPISDILLIKLFSGQRLNFKAISRKGTGNIHAKWSPFGAIWYHPIKTNNDKNGILFTVELTGSIRANDFIKTLNNLIST